MLKQTEKELNYLKNHDLNAEHFPREVISQIEAENLWNLWVPENFGGREKSLIEGLRSLQYLAQTDGSLGWTVTLCSGANYFIGNLRASAREQIFSEPSNRICFGGSGSVSGTAEKEGNYYRISGQWKYATGAPYLSHFTLNAELREKGQPITDTNGDAVIRSFVIPKEKAKIIEDWKTMGLKASATHSFSVDDALVHRDFSFHYDTTYLPQAIFKIPFRVFADLTLWINYIGMGEHFSTRAKDKLNADTTEKLERVLTRANKDIYSFAKKIESKTNDDRPIEDELKDDIHQCGVKTIRQLSEAIIQIYPFTGIKGSSKDQEINQVFRDYFTATQHFNFTS